MAPRPPRSDAEPSAARVEALITRHGPALLRVAKQFSLCTDDALDAYQRALEIYLRRLSTVDPATEGAWMRVVVKHEALAVRKARAAAVDREELDLDATVPAAGRELDERVASGERLGRSVEALRALKPDEARALLLKAEGLSYDEIGKRFGWTYTKVNRSITEGRARFMKVYRGIEAGEACERHADALAALAAGTASSGELVTLRPHLRHCARCRAAVRELHLGRRRRLALVLPVPAIAQWLARLASTDVSVPLQAAVSGGGGRVPAAAAAIAIGLGSAGAAQHALPRAPGDSAMRAHAPASEPRGVARPRPVSARPAPAPPSRPHARRATAPAPEHPRRLAREPAPAPAPAPGEFGFEPGTGPDHGAAAPAAPAEFAGSSPAAVPDLPQPPEPPSEFDVE